MTSETERFYNCCYFLFIGSYAAAALFALSLNLLSGPVIIIPPLSLTNNVIYDIVETFILVVAGYTFALC